MNKKVEIVLNEVSDSRAAACLTEITRRIATGDYLWGKWNNTYKRGRELFAAGRFRLGQPDSEEE